MKWATVGKFHRVIMYTDAFICINIYIYANECVRYKTERFYDLLK